ncbi:malonic semialdehyde reductase [Kineococcus sp. SYSU DK004]|uniref:malonic semialdehyde reductase n=1 Tax=Kineococcus sp. SYSU DK004 TaxID=3383125 RepID=UPI003D7D5BE1
MTVTTDTRRLDEAAADLLFREARTAGTFTGEEVTDEQVRAIYDLVKYAPTSMNTQPVRLLLVRTPEARERLATMMAGSNGDKVRRAPLSVVVAADRNFHDRLPEVFPHFPGARDLFADDEPRHRTAVFNGAMQLAYLVIGVRALGLDAGPMTGIDAPAIEEAFFAGLDQEVLAVVNVGVAEQDAAHPRLPRLPYEDVVRTV